MHRIVFDSNQLIGGHLYTPALTLLRGLAEERRIRLAAPEIVMTELSSAYQRTLEPLLEDSLNEALSEKRRAEARLGLVRRVQAWSTAPEFLRLGDAKYAPRIDTAIKDYEEELQRVAAREVLSAPAGAEKIALAREARRVRPALADKKAGKGARDVLAWLTYLDAAKESQCPIFVSQDGGFVGDDGRLHEDLAREARSLGAAGVKFFSSTEELIAWLANTDVESPQQLEDIVRSELFGSRLQYLLHFHDRIRIDLSIWFEGTSALPTPTLKGWSIIPEPAGQKVNQLEVAKIGDRLFAATRKLLKVEIEYASYDRALGVQAMHQAAFTLPFAMRFVFEVEELARVELFPAGFIMPADLKAPNVRGSTKLSRQGSRPESWSAYPDRLSASVRPGRVQAEIARRSIKPKFSDANHSDSHCRPWAPQGILVRLDQRETSESKKGKLPSQGASP